MGLEISFRFPTRLSNIEISDDGVSSIDLRFDLPEVFTDGLCLPLIAISDVSAALDKPLTPLFSEVVVQ